MAQRVPAYRIVAEWISALADPFTYSPRRNLHLAFGFLWGLPIPFVTVAIHSWAAGAAPLDVLRHHPVHWLFAAHPILFAVVFGAMGTVRARQDREISSLVDRLRKAAADLAAANAELRALDAAKQRFIADVVHELRTPLVSVSGYLELALEGRLGTLDGRARDGLRIAMRNAERLERMIFQLLDLARAESGALVLERTSFDLREAVREVAEALHAEAQRRGLSLEVEIAAGPLPVHADRGRLQTVVSNLVVNALKYTPAGGTVRLAVRPVEEGAEVTVSDTGPGLSDETRAHLFERFAPGGERRNGAGLGLAIVKTYLDAHGIGIGVLTSPGSGTQFRFVVPFARGGCHDSASNNVRPDH